MRRSRTAVTSLQQTIFALLLLFVLPPVTNAEVLKADIAQSLIDENGYAEIPNTYTTIGNYVFQYATSLTSIVIPDSVTSIGGRAHTVNTAAEAAYQRGDYLIKRREIMDGWGRFCYPNNEKVIRLRTN